MVSHTDFKTCGTPGQIRKSSYFVLKDYRMRSVSPLTFISPFCTHRPRAWRFLPNSVEGLLSLTTLQFHFDLVCCAVLNLRLLFQWVWVRICRCGRVLLTPSPEPPAWPHTAHVSVLFSRTELCQALGIVLYLPGL